MTMSRVEVITSVERRRRWSREEKEQLVAATLEPGARVSEVAQGAGIHASQLFRWRNELCQRSEPSEHRLVPVQIASPSPTDESPRSVPIGRETGMIEIDLGGGRRVRVDRDFDREALCRVLDVLAGR